VTKRKHDTGKPPDANSPIYLRINEVHQFAQRGYSPAWIAETLCLSEAEVVTILIDPAGYQKAHGIRMVKAVNATERLPTPETIAAECAVFRLRYIRQRLDETSTHYDCGGHYVKEVVPRPRYTRRGY